MTSAYQAKLQSHIRRTGNYPALVVRPHPARTGQWQILDGHQRKASLQALGREHARCQIWHVDDPQALILIATLNHLHGQDDPYLRGHLLQQLTDQLGIADLARQITLDAAQIRKYIAANQPPPPLQPPQPLGEMIHPLTIFLTHDERRAVVADLKTFHPDSAKAVIIAISLAKLSPSRPDLSAHSPA